jgi:hypothetical protein
LPLWHQKPAHLQLALLLTPLVVAQLIDEISITFFTLRW